MQALGILIVGALLWFVVPPLVGQLATFADRLPSYVDRVHQLRGRYDVVRRHYPELASFDNQISEIAGRLASRIGSRLVDLPTTSASIVFDLVTIYVLATLIVTRRERLLEGLLVLVSPSKRPRTRAVMDKVWWRLGAYLRAKVIVMLIVGALMYVALVALGVPFAVPLAVLVAFGELVPTIGPWIARIPLLSIAAFEGWRTLLAHVPCVRRHRGPQGVCDLAAHPGPAAQHRPAAGGDGRPDRQRAHGRALARSSPCPSPRCCR